MQTLRDTIIAREEAWDKAMEREHNYRQQLTRLTTETITARHLSETRNEELKVATNTLLVMVLRFIKCMLFMICKLCINSHHDLYVIIYLIFISFFIKISLTY